MIRYCYFAALAVVWLGVPFAAAADHDANEQALRGARIGTDGPALLTFFKNRIVNSADRAKIAALIVKLGDDEFQVREQASADLIAIGGRAETQLREAARDTRDAEIKRRAEDCLRQLSREAEPAILAAAARVLGARHPEGAAAVLLEYLPEAPGEVVIEAIGTALEGLAVKDGKADPAVVKALEDKSALRRALAAAALIRAGSKDHLAAVRKLLEDRDSKVRLRVALALVFAKDKDAVPALIDLLGEVSVNDGYEAEDILRALAGDAAPDVMLGKDAAERKKCREVSRAAWWKKDGGKVDLAKLADGAGTGRTLIVQMNGVPGKPNEGRVMEVGRDGNVRWKIEGLDTPIDAQMLPGGRVLICEYRTGRLTERNLKGEILWDKKAPGPAAGINLVMGAQRLPNGNTFIVTRMGLYEWDRDGKEVWSYKPAGAARGAIYAARKSRTGEVALVTLTGNCVLLDAKGKETASFQTGRVRIAGGIDLLPNGNVLVPDYVQSKVREYDPKGKVVSELDVQRPTSAMRLPNGHTLVTLMVGKTVIELDKDGKEVWKCETEGMAHKAYRR